MLRALVTTIPKRVLRDAVRKIRVLSLQFSAQERISNAGKIRWCKPAEHPDWRKCKQGMGERISLDALNSPQLTLCPDAREKVPILLLPVVPQPRPIAERGRDCIPLQGNTVVAGLIAPRGVVDRFLEGEAAGAATRRTIRATLEEQQRAPFAQLYLLCGNVALLDLLRVEVRRSGDNRVFPRHCRQAILIRQ